MISTAPKRAVQSPRSFVHRLWAVHAPLTAFGLLTAVLTLFFIVGIFADSRLITGAPAWLKPTKFGVSITVYTLTLTWLLGFIRTEQRWKQFAVDAIGWIVAAVFVAEMVPIVMQVVRGTTSHFDVSTPFDTFWWSVMGVSIVVLWITNVAIAGLLLFQRFDNPAFAWSLRLGLIITIIGMSLGFLMTSPTAQQMAAWEAGAPVTIVGAHTVGFEDGGSGLPVVNWSTRGGDLRIGHFVGMHALQVIPFLGWFITRRRRLSRSQQTALVWLGAAGYLGVTLLVTWQALRAQSVIAPDALTLGAFAAIVVTLGLIALGILAFGRGAPTRVPQEA